MGRAAVINIADFDFVRRAACHTDENGMLEGDMQENPYPFLSITDLSYFPNHGKAPDLLLMQVTIFWLE